MTASRETARLLWHRLEPIYAVAHFSPEPLGALKAAGYRGFWMGYFASRAAPLGPASAELVHALFANFAYDHVARAIPDAWNFAAPEVALAARRAGSVAALRRQLGPLVDGPDIARAAELAARAAANAPLEGRPLFAANRALPEPDEPLELLWHSATLLREHRGDGHVAALTASGLVGRLSHVFHALATGTSPETYALARTLHEDEWADLAGELRRRGLVDGNELTPTGHALKQTIEDVTDDLAWTAYAALSPDETAELARLLRPMTVAVIESGDLPLETPIGLNLADVLAE